MVPRPSSPLFPPVSDAKMSVGRGGAHIRTAQLTHGSFCGGATLRSVSSFWGGMVVVVSCGCVVVSPDHDTKKKNTKGIEKRKTKLAGE